MHLFRLGFFDGAAELHYCLSRGAHEYPISVKLKERLKRKRRLHEPDLGENSD